MEEGGGGMCYVRSEYEITDLFLGDFYRSRIWLQAEVHG